MSTKDNLTKILFVEDLLADYELAQYHLKKEWSNFESIRVETEEEFLSAVETFKPDLIISDYSMPRFNGRKALELCLKNASDTPFIILTGSMNETTAVNCLKAGAVDYVIKEHITRLPYAVKEALEQKRVRLEREITNIKLEEEQAKLASIYRTAPVGIGLVVDRVFLDVNRAFCDMLGYRQEELIGQNSRIIYPNDEVYEFVGRVKHQQISQKGTGSVETQFKSKNGDLIDVMLSSTPIDLKDHKKGVTFTVLDISDRIRKENRLRESEEKFRSLITQMQLGLAVHEIIFNHLKEPIDYRFLDLNPSYEKMTGLNRNSVIGRSIMDINPETDQQLIKKFAHVALTGELLQYEMYEPALDKNLKVVAYQPRVNHFAVILEDVSIQVKAKLALKESELHFRTLADSGQALIWTSGLDKMCNYFNKPWLRFTGRKLEQELGNGWLETVHPDDRDHCVLTYETSFEQRERFSMIYRMLHKDGTYHWIQDSGSPRYDLNGSFIGYIGHCLDISKQIETQKALQRRGEIDSALAELSSELLKPGITAESVIPMVIRISLKLTNSRQGFISSINSRTGEHEIIMPNSKEDENEESPFYDKMMVKGVKGAYNGLWGHALNTGKAFFTNHPAEHPASVNTPDWHLQVNNYLAVPVTVEGELLGQIALANSDSGYTEKDIKTIIQIAEYYGLFLKNQKIFNAFKESEEKLRQSQKMEAIGRLAGGVAHDYNNMLQTILGYTELMLGKFEAKSSFSVETMENYLIQIKKAADQSADLTKQLLAFARKQAIKPDVLDINNNISDLLKMLQRLIGEDITLIWKPGKNLHRILIDPTQLYQVLVNLVVNSRDALVSGGIITIETENVYIDESCFLKYDDCKMGGFVKLSITDNGCGIPDEYISKIFEPFFTSKELGKGTGLGLSTVYGIVKQNNGFLDVHSKLNEGSCFSIFFPAISEKVLDSFPETQLRLDLGLDTTILVVEDEEMLLDFVCTVLEQQGIKTLKSQIPSEALRIASQPETNIDLLLTDVVMPEMNGKELYDKLKPQYPNMQCVYMSGYTANVINHLGVLDNGITFLQKPFSSNTLIKTIAELLVKSHG